MRIRNLLIAVAVLAIAVPGLASAAAPTGFKVTGGGQIIADPSAEGPGDTVGFNAQELPGDDELGSPDADDAARGQFQYVPRDNDADDASEKFHGVVTCLLSGGEADANETNGTPPDDEPEQDEELLTAGMARFGGYVRGTGTGADNPYVFFTVDVNDNDQDGDDGGQDDVILVRITELPCADNPEDEANESPEDMIRLGRGNVTIHNNPDGETANSVESSLAVAALVADAQ